MSDAADAGREMVVLGRIGGPRGVCGEVRVQSWTRPPENILELPVWWVESGSDWVPFGVSRGRVVGRSLCALLEGVDDRDRASAALTGRQIAVPRVELASAAEDEVYWADLEGLAVHALDGTGLGHVDHLIETGANDVLVVRGDRERLIPFTREVIASVDLQAGRLTVDWDPDF